MTKIIKSEDWYTLQDIVKEKMFVFPSQPWKNASSFYSVRNIVNTDKKRENLLQANIEGKGRGKKYHFKGENIIKFIQQVEAGKVRL